MRTTTSLADLAVRTSQGALQAPRRTLLVLTLLLALLTGATHPAVAQCTAATNVVVGSITGTTAQLTFVAGTGAQSYTVSYTSPSTGVVMTVSPNPIASPVTLTGLAPATGYTVTIVSNCSGGQTAGATISFATVALNDEPCTATALPLSGASCQPVSASSAGATPTPANGYSPLGCAGSQNPNDVWFRFTTAATGPASTGTTLTLTGAPAGQLRLFAATSCTGPFSEVACTGASSPGGPAPTLAVAGLSPATTYYAAVSSYNGLSPLGAFTICVSDPPACAAPLNVTVGSVRATSAQLTFSPGPGNTNYAVSYYPTATPAAVVTLSPNPTTQPITLGGLQPLTAYTVTLQARCGSTGTGVTFTRTFTTTNAQDEPANAVALPVNATCQPSSGTNVGATTTAPNGYTLPTCGGNNLAPEDIWYTLTTPATGAASQGVSVSVTGVPAGILTLFSSANGAAGPFTPLGCSRGANLGSLSAAPPLTVLGLTPATTYYLSVAPASSGGGGAFTLCATPPLPCPAPTGLSATAITQTAAQLSWSVPGATSGTFTVEYGPQGFAPGTGASGAVVVPGLTGLSYAIASGLQPGAIYDFYVTRDCGGAGSSPRTGPGRFSTLGTSTTAPANDLPCNAVALALSGSTCGTPTAGTVQFATPYYADPTVPKVVGYRCGTDANTPSSSGNNAGGPEVWYRFTTAATGPASTGATITVSGASEVRVVQVLQATSACGGPYVVRGCSDVADTNPTSVVSPLVVTGLTPATTYYVAVCQGGDLNRPDYQVGSPLPTYAFTICVSDPLSCPPPTRVAYAAAVTSTGATVTFTAANGAASYTVTATPTAGGPAVTLAATGSPAQLVGLTPNTTYNVCVTATCGSAGASPSVCTTLTTLLPGPPNYLCRNAVPLTCGQTVVGNHANVPQVGYPPNAPGAVFNSPGVYYSFVGTGDSIVVSTCNQNTRPYGGVIAVYSGSCTNLTAVTGLNGDPLCSYNPIPNNPFATYFTTTGFLSLLGTQYYIYVGTYDPMAAGPFGLSLQCIPLPCPAPGAVVVSNLTPTSASVRFTAAAGSTAPGYTVRATPTAGGPSITGTGTGSPIVLTGLAPNTSYSVTVVANCTANATSAASPAVVVSTPLASRPAALAALVDLFPNPAHHSVTLAVPAQLLATGGAAVVLFDGLGRAVQTHSLPTASREQRLTLDLSAFPPGLYVLRLSTARGVISKPLVIE